MKAIALITGYTSATVVSATITSPWPNTTLITANNWRLTVTTVSGVAAVLEAGTVSMLLDGAACPDQIYLNGNITLPFPASVVQLGLRSPAVWQSMRPDSGDKTGSAIGKKRRVIRATVRVKDTLGIELGRDISDLDVLETRPPDEADDNPPPLLTGDIPRQTFSGDFDRDGRVMIRVEQPLPATVVAVAVMIDEQEDT